MTDLKNIMINLSFMFQFKFQVKNEDIIETHEIIFYFTCMNTLLILLRKF